MKYRFNLVRDIQRAQREAETSRVRLFVLIASGFGLLVIALFYAVLQTLSMYTSVQEERARLRRIKIEYRQYQASTMIVNQSDIALLDRLQHNRIFWTKKLVSMASALPENFWITKFAFDRTLLTVDGYGYLNGQQEQLITLDNYLTALRTDTLFCDVFKQVRLVSAIRSDDMQHDRISFSYSAQSKGPTP